MKNGTKRSILGLSFILFGVFLQFLFYLIANEYSDDLNASQTQNLRIIGFALSGGLAFMGLITLMTEGDDK